MNLKNDRELNELLDHELGWLKKHFGIIDFVSIGGSIARRQKSEGSDLDVFVHCKDVMLQPCKNLLESAFPERYHDSLFSCSPYIVEGFGIRYAVIRKKGVNIDYFLVSPSLICGYESFCHHLLYIGPSDNFSELQAKYSKPSASLHYTYDVASTFLRIYTNAERMVKNFKRHQYYEVDRSYVALRAIGHGLKKWQMTRERFDWFSCNLLDENIRHFERQSLEGNVKKISKNDITNLLRTILVILDDVNFEDSTDVQNTRGELQKLLKICDEN